MSSLGPIQYERDTGSVFLGRDYTSTQKNFSVETATKIDAEIRKIIDDAHAEAIRVIKEMREKTNGRYPRYIVWENVRGAFSSNKGNDFWKVLKEITSIKGCKTDIPRPEKWANAGLIMGGRFLRWMETFRLSALGSPPEKKTHLPCRRFCRGGAKKILFKSEGLSGYSAESFRAWQTNTRCVEEGIRDASNFRIDGQSVSYGINYINLEYHPHDSRIRIANDDISQTLNNRMGTGGNNVPLIMEGAAPKTEHFRCEKKGGGKGVLIQTNKSATLACNNDQTLFQPVYSTVHTDYHVRFVKNKIGALVKSDYKDPPIIYDSTNKHEYIIRRLTPIECARLQGFPDWWCSDLETENPTEEDIKFWTDVFETHRKVITKKKRPKTKNQIVKWLKNPRKDSAEYKMWGNGITLPVAVFVLSGIVWADSDDCKTG
jgi:DNA (cytosine-5)-methyltransferase 1